MILGLYGASGLGAEYLYVAEDILKVDKKWENIIFVDDTPEKRNTQLLGRDIVSFDDAIEKYGKENIEFIISIGEPAGKELVYKKLKENNCNFTMLLHPTSDIGNDAKLGDGVVIQSFVRISPMAQIGNNVLVQGTCCLGHGVVVGDNSVISSFVFIGGDTTIGKNTYIAPHSCLRNAISVGSNVIIGMGSVVTKDIPDNAVAYGNPCRVVRNNDSGKVFSK